MVRLRYVELMKWDKRTEIGVIFGDCGISFIVDNPMRIFIFVDIRNNI